MKKALKYTFYVSGFACVLLFYVSATAGITNATDTIGRSFSEPINMILFGIGLIGMASFAKNRWS